VLIAALYVTCGRPSSGHVDRDAGGPQAGDARAVDLVGRVDHRGHDPVDARGDQRVRARRRATVVAARLEVHVDGRTAGVARRAQRGHLGMVASRPLVPALPHDGGVAHDHRADDRVRRRGAAAALGQLGAAGEMAAVGRVDHDARVPASASRPTRPR
jgi:hypothetical protein